MCDSPDQEILLDHTILSDRYSKRLQDFSRERTPKTLTARAVDPTKMSTSVNAPVSTRLLPQHREVMLRLLESQTFSTAPRLRDVLAYLLRTMEEETADEITEQSIGQVVFGRPPGYNASEDNIVRVTVRHLRNRLKEYYSSEGATDPIILAIPKGRYIPSFVAREASSSDLADEMAETRPELDSSEEESRQDSPAQDLFSRDRLAWRWIVLAAAALIIAFTAGYAVRSALRPPTQATGIMGALFPPGDDVTLVTVDANLQAYRQIFKRQVSLEDYILRTYATESVNSSDPRIADAYRFATGTNQTNVSSVIIGVAVRHALEGRRLIIKHPHDVSVRDFQDQGNVILLGGPWANPWGQLFENRFNFRVVPEPGEPSSSEIHNLHPMAGEAAEYRPHMDGNLNVNYVRVAILPNLDNTGHVILMSATSPESLEAASEYLLSAASYRELLARFHARSIEALPPVEFLLEAKGLNAAPGSRRILSIRIVK